LKVFSILGGALLLAALLAFFPVIRGWWRSFLSKPGAAVILILALVNTFFSSGEQANIASIQSGDVDPYRMVRAILTSGLFTIACFQILKDTSRIRFAGSGARWMVVYALLAMMSAIYSVNALVSFWKGFEVMTLVLVAVSLAGLVRTTEGITWLMNVASFLLLYIVLTVYVGLALYPGDAIKDVEYLGVRGLVPLMNPSSVGTLSSLLIVLAVGNALHRWPSKKMTAGIWVVLAAATGMLVLSHVRTPIFAAAVAIMLMLISGRHYRAMVLTALLGTGLVLAMSLDDILAYLYRGQSQEAFLGLTGRMYYWEQLMPMVTSSPVIGHGYYAAQRILFNVNAVDNAYLEVLIGLGVLGVAVFLMPTLFALKSLIRTRPTGSTPLVNKFLWAQLLGIFTILLIRGLSGSSYQVQHPLLIFFMLMQIGIAALVRLNSVKVPIQTPVDTKTANDEPVLYDRRKSRILSTRRH
jgi:O-antigen ligase